MNLAAIERNCARLRAELRPGASLCAVVKADGYGHGAVQSARAAQAGGAIWLAVATAAEAAELRFAGIAGCLLVLGALTPGELDVALGADADVIAWSEEFVAAVADRAGEAGARVHVKLDTGMGRLGTRDPAEADRVAAAVLAAPRLELAGAMTHFATADELGDGFFPGQLERFRLWALALKAEHPGLALHAANSAALLRDEAAHFDLARAGVAIYGLDPFQRDAGERGLEPALELRSWVAALKHCEVGESAGYGRRFIAQRPTTLGVLPLGYGDGVRRALANNADVLVGGQRRALVGAVSMDNVTVDLGDPRPDNAGLGAEAVLVGAQGSERITVEELAKRLGTINYEITCGLSARVPRAHHRDGEPVADERARAAAGGRTGS
ncbi:MAG: alanine racemase [Solirubrobacteraceae bacterium]